MKAQLWYIPGRFGYNPHVNLRQRLYTPSVISMRQTTAGSQYLYNYLLIR